MVYILAIYEIDRQYGGPEEGGWWFDSGELIRVVKTFRTEQEAFEKCRRANILLRKLQGNHLSVNSVNYTGGRYAFDVYKDIAPSHYPETRPYYE